MVGGSQLCYAVIGLSWSSEVYYEKGGEANKPLTRVSKKTSDLDLAQIRLQVIDEATEKTSFHHRDTEGTEKTSKCSARLFNDDG